ncbi:MAG: hypothetical protein HOP23_08900 [Methylococcaceae bacterium]|nr:hypothetical protein [Methylococcaceae bacterium]
MSEKPTYHPTRCNGGKTQETSAHHYNLDAIISDGYRVKSPQGAQFHIWATSKILKQ